MPVPYVCRCVVRICSPCGPSNGSPSSICSTAAEVPICTLLPHPAAVSAEGMHPAHISFQDGTSLTCSV